MSSNRPPFPRGSRQARENGRKGGTSPKSSASRKRVKPWSGTIIDLMDLAGMVGDEWANWRVFWKAVYALPLDAAELLVFQKHTKRDTPPAAPVAEAWMPIGRGGGKTRNSSMHAVFRAITFDSSTVDPGEDVIIPLLASDRRQARAALGYVKGFNALPQVAPFVARGTLKEVVEYRTGVSAEILTASRSAPRGFTVPSCCADEIASWKSDDDGANPDSEVLTAVRGALGRVPGSLLLVLSNPIAPKGELFETVEQFYGKDDPDVLVWNADTLSMNSTYDQRTIARAFARDPVVASSEFGSGGHVVFRQAHQTLFDAAPLDAVIVAGRRELPPTQDHRPIAFIDAAQGSRSGDSMTLGIAHKEGGVAVLDLLREIEPPFNPGQVIANQFAPVLREYGITKVTGDRHALGFVSEAFASCGIRFEPTTLSKSELYAEFLALVNTEAVALLDHPTMKTQLLALERRSMRGGRESIDHPRGANSHDDVANVAAGALVLVSGVRRGKKFQAAYGFEGSGPIITGSNSAEAMRELIARTKARAEAEAQREWEISQASEALPMPGSILFHVHGHNDN